MKNNTLLSSLGITIILNVILGCMCAVIVLIGLLKYNPMLVLWTYFIYKLISMWLAGVTKRLGKYIIAKGDKELEADTKVSDK